MLVLSSLTKLLNQVLSPNDVHTAVLLTPSGELVSYVSLNNRPKDEVRVIVGLSSEVWSETKNDEEGMLDSEMGRLLVLPVGSVKEVDETQHASDPVLLLALNAAENVNWASLQIKGRSVVNHLAKPLAAIQAKFTRTSPAPSTKPERPNR